MSEAVDPRPRLLIVSRLYPRPGKPNAAPFNVQQWKRLAQRYRISLLVPVSFNEWLRHRAQLGPITRDGIEVRYAAWFFPPKLARTLYPAWFALSLLPELGWLKQQQASCLLASFAFPDAVGVLALNRALRLPLLVRTHGSDINQNAHHPLRARLLRLLGEQAQGVICVSRALAQRMVEIGVDERKIAVIPNGVDPGRFALIERAQARAALGLPAGRRLVLFVGNLLRTKGTRELLQAFARLARERPELDLVLVGEGPERRWLEQSSARSGLGSRVSLIGRVDHERVGLWINAADLLCLPSYNEGLPNVVLEALCCGVPVVATQVGGIPEVVDPQQGELVAPKDAAALAAALGRVLDASWDRRAIAALATRFSWDANIEATSALIERAIAAGRSPRSA